MAILDTMKLTFIALCLLLVSVCLAKYIDQREEKSESPTSNPVAKYIDQREEKSESLSSDPLAVGLAVTANTFDQILSGSDNVENHPEDENLNQDQDILSQENHSVQQVGRKYRKKRKAIKSLSKRWTDNVIPFAVDWEAFRQEDIWNILLAIKEWEKKTCLRFIYWGPNTKYTNYIYFRTGGECSSLVGMVGVGRQDIYLASYCTTHRVILHEIGHAIGFEHEHQRPDRDDHVKIVWPNTFMYHMFEKYSVDEINNYGVPYDYNSIMHYRQHSPNKKVWIKTLDPKYQNSIGEANELSYYDAKLANLMYRCNEDGGPKIVSH